MNYYINLNGMIFISLKKVLQLTIISQMFPYIYMVPESLLRTKNVLVGILYLYPIYFVIEATANY